MSNLFSGCDVDIDEPKGYLTSPKYPSRYSPRLSCEYRLPKGRHYAICFKSFDVPGTFIALSEILLDIIQIRQGVLKSVSHYNHLEQ